MSVFDRLLPAAPDPAAMERALAEAVQPYADTVELLTERLAELELAQDDAGWIRMEGEGEREFSREGLRRITALSRLMFLKNPLINRAVTLQSMYVWAQGVEIGAADEAANAVVQAFLDDPDNRTELTGHQARTLKEQDLQVTGNLFFVFFVDRVNGTVRLRTIPADEIAEIVTDPDDAKAPWFYKRAWSQRELDGRVHTYEAFYPSFRYPTDRPRPFQIGDAPVLWDFPVYHVKVGGLPDMRFGLPETYQALDWARAYKSFLEDWATITRALARFAWNLKTKGGAPAVARAEAKLGTTISNARPVEGNPPPLPAATFIAGEGADMQPVKTAGATTSAEDGRRLLLMVAAAFGFPETFFGDVNTGNLATAKSLDRPTELKFLDRQALWKDVIRDITGFALEAAVRARKLPPTADRTVEVTFPPILEHDVAETIAAVVAAATLDGKTPAGTMDARTLVRLLLTALGVDNIDELLDALAPEGGESLMDQLAAQRAEQAQALADRKGKQDDDDDEEKEATEALLRAAAEMREALS